MDAFHSNDSTEKIQNLENLNGSVDSFLNCTILGAAHDKDAENNYDSEMFSELDEILDLDCSNYKSYKTNLDQIKHELNEEKVEEIRGLYREYTARGESL